MRKIEDIALGPGIFRGVPEELISEKEGELGVKFPSSYKIFLLTMGEYATFLAGESCFFEDIEDVQTGFKNTFSKYVKQYQLTDEDFAFSSSQGTSYTFFKLNEGEDPPVYFYIEGYDLELPVRLTNSLSNYLIRRSNRDSELYSSFYEAIGDDRSKPGN